jgi:hypothetical protein
MIAVLRENTRLSVMDRNPLPSRECTSCQRRLPTDCFHKFGRDGQKIGKWCEPCYQRHIGQRLVKRRANNASREARKRNQMPAWADRNLIEAIYRIAREATELTGHPHQVEHWVPLAGQAAEVPVSGLHCPANLRICPADLNQTKSNRFSKRDAINVARLSNVSVQGSQNKNRDAAEGGRRLSRDADS